MRRTRCRHSHRHCGGSRHRTLQQRCERSRLRLLGMLLSRMLVRMVMVIEVKRKRNSSVHVVVWEMVVHRGMSHWVVEDVMVMVVVLGPKRRERQWQGDWRWGHREQVCTRRRLPLPACRRLCRLSPALLKVFLQMAEQSDE